ncbi:BOLA class I histocompatibility antigen, alpha chain BL3-7-like [Cololabis saira]|uniref:BOLA class I histocompatibility antigen, alpha chain BL3-7-like n=1 Tax=Cololabis saira TaxID=129043 RepID=UPI002AD3630E|nr:BOLA class I histocompatibility antigen, alpha chain BL3-7-like [Cololabis saira]
MQRLVFLLLFGVPAVTAVTHSLKYFYTVSSRVPNFPEFVVVGLVDDVPMVRYDSNTNKAEAKQDWMSRVTEEDPQYLEGQTGIFADVHQVYKADIETVKQRLNQTGGVHIFQNMYGCEWDDETGDVKGYYQFGYDGEDFISLDSEKMESWIAAKPEAVISKHKWENEKAWLSYLKNYFTQDCPEWVKKYVNYGRTSLMRTERPSLSLLQKTPVTCHATGFYPNRAELFWRKDGKEIHEGVDKGEILPNHDGTFQMSVDLRLPSNSSEDWRMYECVFQLSGDRDDIVTKGRAVSNKPKPSNMNLPIIVALVTLAAVVVAVVVGVVLYIKNDKRSPSPESQESNKKMLPKA